MSFREVARVEWPTVGLLLLCYAGWAGLLSLHPSLPWIVLAPPLALVAALHSSLQHEAVHGHPTRLDWLNEALVFPSLWMLLPWRRYRDMHLAHHRTGRLTDPLEDPESHFVDAARWRRFPGAARLVLAIQSTLAGRLLLGPPIMVASMIAADARSILRGDGAVLTAWVLHLCALAPVLAALAYVGVPPWLYLLTVAWPASSLLMLRGYAEHRPAETQAKRSVLIESGPLLSLIFLNNNLHALHHARPSLPWYTLPETYRRQREALIAANGGYRYAGYRDMVRRHLFDPPRAPLHPDATARDAS